MSKSSNQLVIPQARAAMDQFKFEAAKEVGVNLKDGYNGDLTTRQAGSIGGQMVKKMVYDYQQRQVGGNAQGLNMTQDLNVIQQQNQNSQS
ncbi:MAG: alpha/beta-type small acid-soluble spore protein [Syntrophomonadaceae bacterium]|nr:alpha/beta-type small acid-soluble spore protein [Syntrophomonadaceae bacterium]